MPKRNGIDVSHYQGVIDWGKVAGSGVVWAATKATQGTTFVDKTLSRNRAGMAEARIKHRLFYHWLNPAPVLLRMSATARLADARKQAEHFIRTIGRLLPGEGVMLDAEQDGIRADQTLEWCRVVEAAFGRPVAVYTGAYVAGGEIWKSSAIYNGKRPRVFAAYSSEERAKSHASPHKWDVWQWTGSGRMPGVNGDVDIDQVDNADIFDAVCGIGSIPKPQPRRLPPWARDSRQMTATWQSSALSAESRSGSRTRRTATSCASPASSTTNPRTSSHAQTSRSSPWSAPSPSTRPATRVR